MKRRFRTGTRVGVSLAVASASVYTGEVWKGWVLETSAGGSPRCSGNKPGIKRTTVWDMAALFWRVSADKLEDGSLDVLVRRSSLVSSHRPADAR